MSLKNARFRFLLLLACLLSVGGVGQATILGTPSDEEMVIASRAIVKAKVLSVESGFDNQSSAIFTYVTLRVKEVLKGELTARKIVLKQAGGQVGTQIHIVFGNPQFATGEHVLLYLDTWADGSLRVHNLFFGKYSIVNDSATGQALAVQEAPGQNVDVLERPANVKNTARLNLLDFTRMVKEILQANKQRAQEFEITNYRAAPLLERPPDYEAMVKSGRIKAAGNFLPLFNVTNYRWFEFDCGLGLSLLTNNAGAPAGTSPKTDSGAAMTAWESVSDTQGISMQKGASTLCRFPVTGENLIIYDNCDSFWSPGSCAGSPIAITDVHVDTNQSKVVSGSTFFRAIQAGISFNPSGVCNLVNNDCNLQEVLTHEIGHVIGLGHSSDLNATMAPVAHFDNRCASLIKDDKKGARFIYPLGTPCT